MHGPPRGTVPVIHEAYLRLMPKDGEEIVWNGRGHFFGAAAEAMCRILVERSRMKATAKRGGGFERISLRDAEILAEAEPEAFVALDEALARLAKVDELNADIVTLHFFAGLSFEVRGSRGAVADIGTNRRAPLGVRARLVAGRGWTGHRGRFAGSVTAWRAGLFSPRIFFDTVTLSGAG